MDLVGKGVWGSYIRLYLCLFGYLSIYLSISIRLSAYLTLPPSLVEYLRILSTSFWTKSCGLDCRWTGHLGSLPFKHFKNVTWNLTHISIYWETGFWWSNVCIWNGSRQVYDTWSLIGVVYLRCWYLSRYLYGTWSLIGVHNRSWYRLRYLFDTYSLTGVIFVQDIVQDIFVTAPEA